MNTDEKRKPISTCIIYATENKKKNVIKLKRRFNSEKGVIKHYKVYQKGVVTPKGRYYSILLVGCAAIFYN